MSRAIPNVTTSDYTDITDTTTKVKRLGEQVFCHVFIDADIEIIWIYRNGRIAKKEIVRFDGREDKGR